MICAQKLFVDYIYVEAVLQLNTTVLHAVQPLYLCEKKKILVFSCNVMNVQTL